jgi:hypothetical protein
MSKRNGDKAKFNRNRKEEAAQSEAQSRIAESIGKRHCGRDERQIPKQLKQDSPWSSLLTQNGGERIHIWQSK